MDLKIKILRKQIVENLNKSDIPMEVKRLILVEILSEVTSNVDKVLENQIENYNKEREESEWQSHTQE